MQATDIDDVLVKLGSIIDGYRARGSALAFFPSVYRATTARVRAGIRAGTFANGPRMDRLATTFANRYLAAAAGSSPGRAWQVAFTAATRRRAMILQHVLVGMNAHINFDLPLAVVAVADGGDLADLKDDFLTINRILKELLDPVQQVIDDFSPFFRLLDKVGDRTDEALVTFSIDKARDVAWHEATRLASEPAALRETSISNLDRWVALLADRIIVPGGILGFTSGLIARTESGDVSAITAAMLAIE